MATARTHWSVGLALGRVLVRHPDVVAPVADARLGTVRTVAGCPALAPDSEEPAGPARAAGPAVAAAAQRFPKAVAAAAQRSPKAAAGWVAPRPTLRPVPGQPPAGESREAEHGAN
ncbi:hypothetical protein JI721_02080 [Alicyclobacillus cycloheptanicus]|uniref:hypothetical protein n=1 Tax=Alicyclobacillus cycloheptanicus TaxID=1457 RepID=UPI002379D604|nr:hypothetical protein [Alicyclobacillus cycloheptanicus]WDM01666.1 hypothetical protein JI721_02080 [Alicyclobacillus cycloheptanicus]